MFNGALLNRKICQIVKDFLVCNNFGAETVFGELVKNIFKKVIVCSDYWFCLKNPLNYSCKIVTFIITLHKNVAISMLRKGCKIWHQQHSQKINGTRPHF